MKIDVTVGSKCGQWTVLASSHKNNHYQNFWHCKCRCGYESILEQSRLANGRTTACKTCANARRRIYKPVTIGAKYGKWLVLYEDPECNRYVYAQCGCKTVRRIKKQSLIYGESTQCHSCAGKVVATRHGHNCRGKTSPEYRAWRNAKNRVSNPNCKGYARYGGRGITMCDRWANLFENFLQDVGLKPSSEHTLERINNNGNYEPNNVRWALPIEQNHNRSVSIKFNGQYINIKELSAELKVQPETIKNLMYKSNFSLEEIREFSNLTHYQKIQMGKSIKDNTPLTFIELTKVKSPVLPSPKRHPLWCTWHSMKQRCNNPKNKDYENYGGRGIKVCDEWQAFAGFLESIFKTIGPKPSQEYQLDRIDNDKNYEPNNVKWATKKQQARNKNATIYLNGIGISAEELASRYNINRRTVITLLRLGWNEDGLKFFAQLTFKEKKHLKIVAKELSQKAATTAYTTLKLLPIQNKKAQI